MNLLMQDDQPLLLALSKGKTIRNFFQDIVIKNRKILDVLLSATISYDDEGNFERSLAGMVDVTARRKTERELMQSRQNLIEDQRISKIGNYELNLNDFH